MGDSCNATQSVYRALTLPSRMAGEGTNKTDVVLLIEKFPRPFRWESQGEGPLRGATMAMLLRLMLNNKENREAASMNKPGVLLLTQEAWNEISRHAQETFPEECCGIVLSAGGLDHIQRLKNIQNKLHALDPLTYPRTAAIAYAMDPLELESVITEGDARGQKLKAFYHSHPEHDAYFSDEDKAFASPFGEPTYPESAQIVISIYNRAVKIIRAFAWSEENHDFIEVPIDRTESHVGTT